MTKKLSGITHLGTNTASISTNTANISTNTANISRTLAKNAGSDTYTLGGSDTMMLFNTGSLLKIYSSDAETSTKLQLTGPSKIHCKNEAEVLMSSGSYITMNAAFGGNPMADIFQEPDFPKADNQGVLYHVKKLIATPAFASDVAMGVNFENVAGYADAGYMGVAFGTSKWVKLRGKLRRKNGAFISEDAGGGGTALLFILPIGFRPATRIEFLVPVDVQNGGTGRVLVYVDGTVRFWVGMSTPNVTGLNLDGIDFFTIQ